MSDIIIAKNLKKVYQRGIEEIAAVNDVSLTIKTGEYVAIVGPSGSGKTTMVNLLGCLDTATSGSLQIGDDEVFSDTHKLNEVQLTKIRQKYFGYIFQKFYLIPTLTVEENVMLPFTFYKGHSTPDDAKRHLEEMGIYNRKDHLPGELSGGEMQRVAIARALVNNPRILLADEPTGNLDTKRTDEISKIFRDLNKKENLTILMVTHNLKLAESADRVIELKDGKLLNA